MIDKYNQLINLLTGLVFRYGVWAPAQQTLTKSNTEERNIYQCNPEVDERGDYLEPDCWYCDKGRASTLVF